MIPLKIFLNTPTNIYEQRRSVKPWWVVLWALNLLGLQENSLSKPSLQEERFVLVKNVEVDSDVLLQALE